MSNLNFRCQDPDFDAKVGMDLENALGCTWKVYWDGPGKFIGMDLENVMGWTWQNVLGWTWK
eukprot:775205-Karenia_brevis.AAC.1